MRLSEANLSYRSRQSLLRRPLHGYACAVAIALAAIAATLTFAASAQASFGILPGSFNATALNRDGSVDVQAGSHPYAYTVNFAFNQDSEGNADGSARDIVVNLPPGFVGNPTVTPRCPRQNLEGFGSCPGNTQIGTFSVVFREPPGIGLSIGGPVYSLVPPPGVAASFGFTGAGFTAIENATLIHSGTDYRVSVVTNNVSHGYALKLSETIWGVPADASHDPERSCISPQEGQIEGCSTETTPAPFATLPTSCNGPLSTLLEADSVEAPGEYLSALAPSLDAGGNPVGLLGCEALDFRPSITARPETSVSASATGLHVDLHMPQDESVGGLAEAHLKNAVVTLPAGVVVNPSSADGLQGCAPAQIDLGGPEPAHCPDASQIGTVEVDTPLLDHPVPGEVYLAAQGDNPFHSLLAIYIGIYDPITGVVVKLAGHVEPDPVTGQLKTTFAENPQFPFKDFKLDFFGGARAPLITPDTCGVKTTTTTLTPWSAPEGQDATPSDSFQITSGPHGSACANSATEEPHHPSFQAGTTVPLAGLYSPFVLKLGREDGSQPISALQVTLPPGLTGKLAGVARCSDAQIAAAQDPGHTGAAELASPSCPTGSEVGTVDVGAGAGSSLLHVTGHAYLAGPYKGAPFSLAIVTPAVAGPFDLGTVVVRSALYVDPRTAQVTVKSDAIPTILDGVPLDVRSIVVNISRDQFTLNPTSCERMSITGIATSALGQQAPLSDAFQVGGCAGLAFKPAFVASTQAKTSKANGASLRVKVSQRLGDANIHKVALQLPLALPSRLTTLQKACTEAQFAANPAGCPEASNIGTATAVTPILNVPLTGPAYLVSHGGAAFPDVVFLLQGEGVQIQLVGNTDIKKGRTFSRFETAPDAPISSFETNLPQGPHSVLAANGNLCAQNLTMPTTIVGQNGAQVTQNTKIAVTGCAKPSLKIKKAKRKGNLVILTLITTRPGTITAGGQGLKSIKRAMDGGKHQVKVPLTTIGKSARHHHRKIKIKASLKGSDGSSSKALSLRL